MWYSEKYTIQIKIKIKKKQQKTIKSSHDEEEKSRTQIFCKKPGLGAGEVGHQ